MNTVDKFLETKSLKESVDYIISDYVKGFSVSEMEDHLDHFADVLFSIDADEDDRSYLEEILYGYFDSGDTPREREEDFIERMSQTDEVDPLQAKEIAEMLEWHYIQTNKEYF